MGKLRKGINWQNCKSLDRWKPKNLKTTKKLINIETLFNILIFDGLEKLEEDERGKINQEEISDYKKRKRQTKTKK